MGCFWIFVFRPIHTTLFSTGKPTQINHDYAKDTFNIYAGCYRVGWLGEYYCERLADVDYATFTPIVTQDISYRFAKDKKSVFFGSKKIVGADPQTFQPLGAGYSKDARSVWWEDTKLIGANPTIFRSLANSRGIGGGGYGKDDRLVFYQDKIVTGADAQSFEWADGIEKDKRYLYEFGQRVSSVSSKGLVFLEDGYSKNETEVYYRSSSHALGSAPKLLSDADAKKFRSYENFRLTDPKLAWKRIFGDGTHFYADGELVEVVPK